MTKHHLLTLIAVCMFFFFLSAFNSCISNKTNQEDSTLEEAQVKLLSKCWTHSYEDNNPNEREVYLPCDAKDFPPSRYRAQFTLAIDGTCSFSILAANDAHTNDSGTWSYDTATKVLVLKGGDGTVVNSFVVELLEEGRMLLK